MRVEAMKQLIEDCISMMEYHVEQTRPIHTTTVAIQAAKEALKAIAVAEHLEAEKRCEYCDGTGDVHDQTGEWRGVCVCEAGKALKGNI